MSARWKVRARRAGVCDAESISALYRRSYSDADGSHPADNYPFPQVLDPEWVARAIAERTVCWFVGETDSGVHGSVAAALVAGGRVAEFFGLVTDAESRGHGLGTLLLSRQCDVMDAEVDVAIGQVRTATPHIARVVKKTPLRPIGFEPFVHHMFGVPESMVAVGAVSPRACSARDRSGRTTERVCTLATKVLGPWGLAPLDVAEAREPRARGATEFVSVRWLEPRRPGDTGIRQRRYTQGDGRFTRTADLAEDPHDHRVCITGIKAEAGGEEEALRGLLETLDREAGGRLLLVVADVLASELFTQQLLESAGFRPVVYYPALVARRGRRLDVVRYLRSSGVPVERSLEPMGTIDWADARAMARGIVAAFHDGGAATPSGTPPPARFHRARR